MTTVDRDFEELLEYVRDARSFDYTGYRRPTLTRRFQKRMQAVGADGWEAYRAYLERHQEEFGDLFDAILINVTGFFRDQETWDVVADEVIPRLLEGKSPDAPVRVWSAGCASGEELYTITMLIAEQIGDEAFKERVKIYATDADEHALGQAREASYSTKQLEAVPEAYREKYFQASTHGFSFRNDLRRCVIFGRNDLLQDPPISRVDLLVSRNTLMYFSSDVQARILQNFHFALNHDGYLVVGKAEALQGGRGLFVPYNLKRRIFQKDGSAQPGFRVPRLPVAFDRASAVATSAELGDAAFEHAPVAQVVVDQEDRVAALNQAARTLFGLKLKDVGRPLQDLAISYKPVELRSLIEEVRSGQRPVTTKEVAWQPQRGEARSLDVQVAPLAGSGGQTSGVGISFVDVTAHRTLEEHLERARRELETAYEELQSTVEELETTNEELQSTNEELETMNEELQSTNEELETMNEELHSTNEELETMNDELRERTEETLRANSFLASVLSSIHQAVVVVDRRLRILAWNRLATELWGLRDDEVEGVHLLNLDIGLPIGELREPIGRVLSGEPQEGLTLVGHNRRGQAVRYTASIAPLDAGVGEVAGAILLMTAERI